MCLEVGGATLGRRGLGWVRLYGADTRDGSVAHQRLK